MVGILEYSIGWLRAAVQSKEEAELIGLKQYEKFCETRCYSKTLLVIDEYYERYKNYTRKMKIFLANKKPISCLSNSSDLKYSALSIAEILSKIEIMEERYHDHNIGVDFLVSMVVLAKMLSTESL